ncbi:MAG: hypothetical protein ACYTHK_05370 [Planctomycetota bacterium]|jgi:hypothetical protein
MRSLSLLLLLCGVALALPEPLPYARTPKEAVEIARTRGKLMFITICVDNDAENRLVIKNVLHNKKWQKVARDFVLIYANKDDDHGSVMVKTESGKKEKRDADVPELTNEQVKHFAYNYVAAFYPEEAEGIYKTPIHFIVNADEELVEAIYNGDWKGGFNHVPADTVIKRMKAALKKYGKGISEKQYEQMRKDLIDAKAAKVRNNVGLEIKHLVRVTALPKRLEDVKRAQARLDELEVGAKEQLAGVEGLVKQFQWEDALAKLQQIEKDYAGLPTALRAGTRRKELMKDKDVKKLLKAKDYYESGMKLLKGGRPDKARKRFELCIKRGQGTKYAELSQAELEKMK